MLWEPLERWYTQMQGEIKQHSGEGCIRAEKWRKGRYKDTREKANIKVRICAKVMHFKDLKKVWKSLAMLWKLENHKREGSIKLWEWGRVWHHLPDALGCGWLEVLIRECGWLKLALILFLWSHYFQFIVRMYLIYVIFKKSFKVVSKDT